MKSLNAIIQFFQRQSESTLQTVMNGRLNTEFSWLSNDSRECSEKTVFIAQQGLNHHGLDFLSQVFESGCRLIISDRPVTSCEQVLLEEICETSSCVDLMVIENLNQLLPNFCHWFYDTPTQKLKVIGITGTNGKTSTAFYCAQLLEAKGDKVAVIGTLGNGSIHQLQATQNTTPDIIRLTTLLAQFVAEAIDWVVMEVSSHAIALGRIAGFEFYTTAITQIGSDHLDFHQTQAHYEQTKLRLFSDFSAKHQVLNLSDQSVLGYLVANELSIAKKTAIESIVVYQLPNDSQVNAIPSSIKCLQATAPDFKQEGLEFKLVIKQNQTVVDFEAQLLGRFNIENLMCAISILNTCGVDLKTLQAWVSRLQAVPGRMQIVHQDPTVVIDFAHTADALENLLDAVKVHIHSKTQQGALGLVFGCGGDRDRQKRPAMAKVAQNYADKIMVTSDNPRTEPPQQIIDEILQGFDENTEVIVDENRTTAIEQVLADASPDDLIVIAGKGHEDYQEIQGVKYPYSDHEVVKHYFDRKQANS